MPVVEWTILTRLHCIISSPRHSLRDLHSARDAQKILHKGRYSFILPWYALVRHRVDSIRFLYRNTNAPFHLVSPHAARGGQAERFRQINRAFDTQAQPLEEVTIQYPCYLINLIIRVRDATSRKIWRWTTRLHARQKNPSKTSPPHN